eukprot:TRINITY_DN5381_c0_g1_i7.p1 TRINITY_DN5381_c0_g1~~TRINITY_DN5381_c0_g1_i7.p1  ORF type:complete len:744 (+),score=128.42 TRINITY_DN5381_c0_g1_i7:44-2275(+)
MVSGPLVSGIAAFVMGIIAISIGVVVSSKIKVGLQDAVEEKLNVKGPEDESYDPWRTNNLGEAPHTNRSFYIYNITNIDDVKMGKEPQYKEVGPYKYRYLFERIDVSISEQDSAAFYRNFNRYVFEYDSATGLQDTDEVIQVNPNYIAALFKNIGPNVTKPVFATALGILSNVCAGAIAQQHKEFSENGTFYNQVLMNQFKSTQADYIKSIIKFGYNESQTAFFDDLKTKDKIDLDLPGDCSSMGYANDSEDLKLCKIYLLASKVLVDIDLTGIPTEARTRLFDVTEVESLGHPSTMWGPSYVVIRPQSTYNPTPHMIQMGITSHDQIKAVFDLMERYMKNVHLELMKQRLKNPDFKYEDLTFAQYGDLSTLSGASIANQDPNAKFFPEFAAYVKYIKQENHTISAAQSKAWLTNFKNATKVGEFIRALADSSESNIEKLKQFDVVSFKEGGLLRDYFGYLYESVLLPICAYTNTGLCLYRKTTVSNTLFGTMSDPLLTFLTQGTRTRAGIFTNHTGYESARVSSPNGDTVDIGTKDIKNIGKYYYVNGASKIVRSDGKTNTWAKEVKIEGSTPQFPPDRPSNYKHTIYAPSLYRNLQLRKVREETIQGIDMTRYEVDPANYEATNDNKNTYFITTRGVMNYSSTEFAEGVANIPILATNPRLLDTDQTIFQGIDCTSTDRISKEAKSCFLKESEYIVDENRKNYTTNFYIEPITGSAMKVNAAIQFWLHINSDGLSWTKLSI